MTDVKWLSLALVASACAICNGFGQAPFRPSTVAPVFTLPELAKKVRPSVVLIVGYDAAGKPTKTGSGFFITADGRLATNFHVIDGIASAQIKMGDGSIYNLKGIVEYSEDMDLAILEADLSGRLATPLTLSIGELPEAGTHVVVIGSPENLEGSLSDGIVSARRRDKGGTWIQITAPISHGSSGSPVLNDRAGVIGVAAATLATGQNLNFARSSNDLFTLRRNDSGQPRSFAEIAAEQVAHQAESAMHDPDYETAKTADTRKDYASEIKLLIVLASRYPRAKFIWKELSPAYCFSAIEYAKAGNYAKAIDQCRLARGVYDSPEVMNLISAILEAQQFGIWLRSPVNSPSGGDKIRSENVPPLIPSINLSNSEALRIGKKIWQNECRGSVAGLTSWNEGENFASLGIGHFIWYPQGVHGPFEESFPKLLSVALDHRANLPGWLQHARVCPWNSRAEFSRAQNSPQMSELRQFLARTVDLQAQFMVGRLQNALGKMLDEAAPQDRANVEQQFARVASTAHGCYALVDYVNFKGEGVLQTERYRSQGWGLLQVLEGMHGTGNGPGAAREFARSAAAVLTRRVQNSPPERKESRWLPGWINRVNSYAENS